MGEQSSRPERALRDSQQRLRLASAAAGLGVFEWDVASDTARWENRRMYEIFGRTPQQGSLSRAELVGQVIEKGDRAAFERALEDCMSGGEEFAASFRIRRADDNTKRWIEVSGRFEHVPGAPAGRLVGVVADVTEQREASEALRRANERYELVLAGADAAIWDWDVVGGTVSYSPRWKAMRGFEEDEVGDSENEWRGSIHPDDVDRVTAAVEAHFEGTTPHFAAEYRVRRKDGSWMWIADRGLAQRDTTGQVVRMAGSETDITERKRAEEALRESEQRLQWALQGADRGVWDWDLVSGAAWWSPEMYELWGVEPGTPMRLDNSLAIVVAQDRGRLRKAFDAAIARHSDFECEFRIDHSRRGQRWMASQGRAVYGVDGSPIRLVGTTADVTQRKNDERERARQRELLQRIVGYIPVLLVIWDPRLERFSLNQAAEEVTGWTTAEANEGNFLALVYPDPGYRAEAEAYMQSLEPGWREWTVTAKDGERIPVEWANIRLADDTMVGIGVDLRERKRAEAALRHSEHFHRQALESIPGMVFTTRQDGYCDYQSQQWVEYTGVPMSEHLGDGWNRLLHPEDQPRAMAAWRAAVADRAPYDLEYRVRRRDGAYEWFKVIGRPIRDEAGRIVRWFGVALNIEKLKRAEESVQASLREKDVLLREIHHRVKNNLQVISSLLSIQSATLGDPHLQPLFNDIRDRVRTMALVHEELYRSDNLAEVRLDVYAANLMRNLWRAHDDASASVALNLELEPATLSVEQAVPCGLILNELATNALKHAFAGRGDGQVTVGLRMAPEATLQLVVRDNGAGLPDGFDWQETRTLGLHLVRLLARQLHAAVVVESGEGTTFRIRFSA